MLQNEIQMASKENNALSWDIILGVILPEAGFIFQEDACKTSIILYNSESHKRADFYLVWVEYLWHGRVPNLSLASLGAEVSNGLTSPGL